MGENVAVVYDRDLAIDIPAGEHRIGVDNMGTDRFSAMFTFEKYASAARGDVTAGALVHSGGAHLRLANRTWSPETIMGTLEAKPANGVTVTLEGLRNANAQRSNGSIQ